MGIPHTPRAIEAVQLMRTRTNAAAEREAAVARFVELAMVMSVQECIDVGFDFADATDHSGMLEVPRWFGDAESHGMLDLDLSPDRSHRALGWSGATPRRSARLWIDGREQALPTFPHGSPLAEPPGWWNDPRFFAASLITPDHPLQDWSVMPGTGQIRGLFIADADSGRHWVVQPRSDEAWEAPLLRFDGARLRVYADRAALDAGVAARVVDVDPPIPA